MNRPKKIPVEEFINNLVKSINGNLVSDLIPKDLELPNADYVFKDYNTVAELKSLEKDVFSEPEDIPRIFDLLDKWQANRLIEEGDKIQYVLGMKTLPQTCMTEFINRAMKSIDNALHKADKQIKSTKQILSMPDSKGLVLLANDGNYFFSHEQMLAVLCNLYERKYSKSHIDAIVYFTVNQPAILPNSELDWNVWIPVCKLQNDVALASFVNMLGSQLNDFYTFYTGIPAKENIKTDDLNTSIEIIKSMDYLPKI